MGIWKQIQQTRADIKNGVAFPPEPPELVGEEGDYDAEE